MNMQRDRVLVTGATGFIGRHLVRRLVASGEAVTLAVRRRTGDAAGDYATDAVRMVETGPLETSVNLQAAFENVTKVVHIAGLAHVRAAPEKMDQANNVATARLVEAAEQSGLVGVFINMSSIGAVGSRSDEEINDATACRPTTSYGLSKLKAERHLDRLAGQGALAVSLRPPVVIGAEAAGNWRTLQNLAWTGVPLPFAALKSRRSMISVETLAEAVMHLLLDGDVRAPGAYCIADRPSLMLGEVIRLLREGMGMPARLFPVPPQAISLALRAAGLGAKADALFGDLRINPDRFERTFQFAASTGIEESIRESGRRYRALKMAVG